MGQSEKQRKRKLKRVLSPVEEYTLRMLTKVLTSWSRLWFGEEWLIKRGSYLRQTVITLVTAFFGLDGHCTYSSQSSKSDGTSCHRESVDLMSVSIDGDYAYTASSKETLISRWKIKPELGLVAYWKAHSRDTHCISTGVSEEGSPLLASAGQDGYLRLWDCTMVSDHTSGVENAVPNLVWAARDASQVWSRGLCMLGDVIGMGCVTTVKLWRLKDGCLLRELDVHSKHITHIMLFQNIIISAANDHTVRVFDLKSPSSDCRSVITIREDIGMDAVISSLSINADGSTLAVCWNDGYIRVITLLLNSDDDYCSTMAVKSEFRIQGGNVNGVSFHPQRADVLIAHSHHGLLSFWDIESGKCLMTIQVVRSRILTCWISPDSRDILITQGKVLYKGTLEWT